jgi:hypothetical protein
MDRKFMKMSSNAFNEMVLLYFKSFNKIQELIFTGLIPGLLCEFVRRAHFGVEEVGKQLAL